MSNIFLLLLMTLFIRCSSSSVQNGEKSKTNKVKDSVNKQKAIDEQMEKGDRPDDEQPTPTPAEERKRLIGRYDQVETFDTTIVNGSDNLNLRLKYYCLRDSSIIVPKTYQSDEKKPHAFTTHPFASTVLLIYNQDTVLNREFKASDFNPFFEDNFGGNLKRYGSILMLPELSKKNKDKGQIALIYSLAIPATDIGIRMYLIITKNGNYKIVENY